MAYLSAEFLLGPHLANNLLNLGITEAAREAMSGLGYDLDEILAQEEEAGLGNGGLGRLADNDVRFVTRTFGSVTAVDEAVHVINSAHTEARSVDDGVAVVKLVGRHAGFIAAAATVASQDVNFCLVPEVPFVLQGPGGLLVALERRLEKKNHAVVIVAEGARRNCSVRAAKGTPPATRSSRTSGASCVTPEHALQGQRHRDDAALFRSQLPDPRLPRE